MNGPAERKELFRCCTFCVCAPHSRPFPCVPDRPSKILLVQVGTLSSSHPSFGVSVFFLSSMYGLCCCRAGRAPSDSVLEHCAHISLSHLL